MQINIHQTQHTIGDFQGIFSYLQNVVEAKDNKGLHLFPELYLTGYPLADLCLQRTFIDPYLQLLEKINNWSLNIGKNEGVTLLFGGLTYSFDNKDLPLQIKNVIYKLVPGKELEVIYTKKLLPNYDIFDEEKYFTPGTETACLELEGFNLGLLICEDMWPSTHHEVDPLKELIEYTTKESIKLDAVINLSASPFNLGKEQARLERSSVISKATGAPLIYVNRVGGEDEILFDGSSSVVEADKITHAAKIFESDVLSFKLEKSTLTPSLSEDIETENTWESLFNSSLDKANNRKTLVELTDKDCEYMLHAIKFSIQEYARKCGFNKFDVALSGGVDSALVLAIMKLSLLEGQSLEAIYMPGFYSASLSYDLSYDLCKNLGVKLYNLPIKFLHSSIRNTFGQTFGENMDGLADENIQSRLRGALLYARSNQRNSMVLNTSNKSEIAVGYSTLYGDSVGALSVLGDLYKSEVFALAKYINRKFDNIIPEGIITRPPSAELREDQEDSQSLPPYDRLDAILEGILSYRYSIRDLLAIGHNKEEVDKVHALYTRSEYKRNQFCPIIKLKAKSFGFGYRIPICKRIQI